jgi:hypothetical protein
MYSKKLFILATLMSLLLLGLWLPANAAPIAQIQYVTPTPGADGRILYVVQAADTCTRVAILNGITVEQLMELNSGIIDKDCLYLPQGQELLIGMAGAAAGTQTAGPSPTPGAPTTTPTPFTGTTEICVLLFDDQNGDALRQETEPAIAGGAISVSENNGEYSAAQNTVINPDPAAYPGLCFSDVPEGTYTVSVAIPDNYNPTMRLSYELKVKAGDRAFVDFGAQSRATTVTEPDDKSGSSVSPALGIIGLLLLLGGGALGYYAWRSGKPESRLGGGSRFLKGRFLKK